MASTSWCHTEKVEPWCEGFGSKGANPVPPNSPPGFLFVRVLWCIAGWSGEYKFRVIVGVDFLVSFPPLVAPRIGIRGLGV